MADDKPLDARAIRLEVTVPCDERFRPVLGVLCERMARYVGYGDVQAEELASAVVHATDGVLEHEESPQYTSLDVTIATSSSEIEFRVRYLTEGATASDGDAGPGIESLLTRPRGDEPALDIIRRVMRRVEFGRSDGVEFCSLSKALPEEH